MQMELSEKLLTYMKMLSYSGISLAIQSDFEETILPPREKINGSDVDTIRSGDLWLSDNGNWARIGEVSGADREAQDNDTTLIKTTFWLSDFSEGSFGSIYAKRVIDLRLRFSGHLFDLANQQMCQMSIDVDGPLERASITFCGDCGISVTSLND